MLPRPRRGRARFLTGCNRHNDWRSAPRHVWRWRRWCSRVNRNDCRWVAPRWLFLTYGVKLLLWLFRFERIPETKGQRQASAPISVGWARSWNLRSWGVGDVVIWSSGVVQVICCDILIFERRNVLDIAARTRGGPQIAVPQPLPWYASSIRIYKIKPFDRAHLTLEPARRRPYFFRFFRIR